MVVFLLLGGLLLLLTCANAQYTVVVSASSELLDALYDQKVSRIELSADIKFGPEFSLINPPYLIQRNVTVCSPPGEMFTLNMAYYSDIFVLGNGVTMDFVNLFLTKFHRTPLAPGLDIIAESSTIAEVRVMNSATESVCCLPPNLWQGWADSYARPERFGGKQQLQVYADECLESQGCGSQSVVLEDFTTEMPHYVTQGYYMWREIGFTISCKSSLSKDCLESKRQSMCLEECLQASITPPPAPSAVLNDLQQQGDQQEQVVPAEADVTAPQTPAPSPQSNNNPSDTPLHSTAVVASIAAALGVALLGVLGVAAFMYHRRNRFTSRGPWWQPKLWTHRNPRDGGLPVQMPGLAPPPRAALPPQHVPSQGMAIRESNATTEQTLSGCTTSTDAVSLTLGSSSYANTTQPLSPAAPPPSNDSSLPGQSVTNINAAEDAAPAGQAGNVGGGSGAAQGGQAKAWDPVNQVKQRAQELPVAEGEKLVLKEPIGKGAFGTVYKGRWRNLDVAVKTMLFSERDGLRQGKAVLEAAVATSVVHPNVVCVYHYDIKPVTASAVRGSLNALYIEEGPERADWKMFLVQELCQTSVAEVLQRFVFHDQNTGAPRLDLTVSVLMDIARGMAYIHSKNIIHGDLKPENVLLKMDGTHPHGIIAKITDFGMCTTLDPGQSHISNFNKGTPFYTAPEVILSHQTTQTSDVFSFGVIMQQMLTGATPWVRTSPPEPQEAPSTSGREGQQEERGSPPKPQQQKQWGFRANPTFWQLPPNVQPPPAYLNLRNRCLDKEFRNRPGFEQILAELVVLYKEVAAAMAAAVASQQAAAGSHLYTLPPVLGGPVGTSYLLAEQHRHHLPHPAGMHRAASAVGHVGASAPVYVPGLAVVAPLATAGVTGVAQPAALDATPVPSGRVAVPNINAAGAAAGLGQPVNGGLVQGSDGVISPAHAEGVYAAWAQSEEGRIPGILDHSAASPPLPQPWSAAF